jgi:hypothetical protein
VGRGKGLSGWYGRGWGQGGEITQALYAHMNNKKKPTKKTMPKNPVKSTEKSERRNPASNQ